MHSVRGVRRVLAYSKKDLLLFRRVHVMGLQRQLRLSRPSERADCEFLIESDFLAEAPDTGSDLAKTAFVRLDDALASRYKTSMRDLAEARRAGRASQEVDTFAAPLWRMASSAQHPSGLSNYSPLPNGTEAVVAYLLTQTGDLSVPIFESLPNWEMMKFHLSVPRELREPSPDNRIVELVLSKLPVPGDDVPLDEVITFSRDDETRRKIEGLEIWMRKAARSGKDLQDLQLEVEDGLHNFAAHMRVADMRSKTSTLRVALSLPLGIVEELLHLRPKKALDVALEFHDRKAMRLEAELNAPGGTFAYIYKAARRFNRDSP